MERPPELRSSSSEPETQHPDQRVHEQNGQRPMVSPLRHATAESLRASFDRLTFRDNLAPHFRGAALVARAAGVRILLDGVQTEDRRLRDARRPAHTHTRHAGSEHCSEQNLCAGWVGAHGRTAAGGEDSAGGSAGPTRGEGAMVSSRMVWDSSSSPSLPEDGEELPGADLGPRGSARGLRVLRERRAPSKDWSKERRGTRLPSMKLRYSRPVMNITRATSGGLTDAVKSGM